MLNETLSLGCGDTVIDELPNVGDEGKTVAENVSLRSTEVLLGKKENSLVSIVDEVTA